MESIVQRENETVLDYFDKPQEFGTELLNGENDLEKQILTLDIVCKYCGDVRATVTIKYKTMKDQGYFRAACICEKCQ